MTLYIGEFLMSTHDTPSLARRGFLKRLSASAAGVAAVAAVPPRLRAATMSTSLYWTDPDAWIDRMRGTDRLVFHAHQHLLPAIVGARNILVNARDSYGVVEADNAVAIATHGPAIAGLFRDEVWEQFRLGEMYGIVDGATGQHAVRNPFLTAPPAGPADATVPALIERGVQFLVCNVAVRSLSRRLAGNADADAMHVSLLAGVVAGTVVVPDLYVALSHAQRRGVSYIYVD
jgi:intracellular sulfur oxidation DsrE/DsrF family protein